MQNNHQMPTAFNPAEVEAKWYPEWERRGYFSADPETARPKYSIVIPPPNVTGMLTMGHILNNTLQDILIRWQKMEGKETCWVPGTDHAGIATQSKVEADLREKEGLTRYDLGREKFLERVWQWKHRYGHTIIEQLRCMGAACAWDRERFTLDKGLSNAVEEVFIRLYQEGLIYKGHRIINWCPASRTALSDEEVKYKEIQGKLWYFSYPLTDKSGHLTVATTRPETMLGDTAVAVHPEDPRYNTFIGKTVTLPILNREIPIVGDTHVEREFGTGALKVTPAHDPNDYELGLRHNLPMIDIMNIDGTMNAEAGNDFTGLSREACREAVVERIRELGLLADVQDYTHQVGYSERGGVPVEPRLSEQWFVKMKPLAKPAIEAVEKGRIRFHPPQWIKTYRHWMENIRDWCISRQLWWGHRIPAYYCAGCGEIIVDKEKPSSCPQCHTKEFHQDEDVLDTWFSSWLWPFSVFGWPEKTRDLDVFYPTNALVTGPDIIFFWVARMIMAGFKFMGDIPFSDVYFTSIIRDDEGQKFSKSLNNSPDPLEVIQTYGADALRFTVIYLAPIGQDIRYSNQKCEIGRNFATKIWNAARFRKRHPAPPRRSDELCDLSAKDLRADDQWILARCNELIEQTSTALNNFYFHEATHAIHDFFWNEFCAWFLESSKSVFDGKEQTDIPPSVRVFDVVLSVFLRLLHPFMPFVTEEVYHQLDFADAGDSIMLASWPTAFDSTERQRLGATEDRKELVTRKFELIRAIRNIRTSYKIAPSARINAVIVPAGDSFAEFLRSETPSIKRLTNADTVDIRKDVSQVAGPKAAVVTSIGTAHIPLAGLIDVTAEKQRLQEQEKRILQRIEKSETQLQNENFIQRAPSAVVDRERNNLAEQREQLERIREHLAVFE